MLEQSRRAVHLWGVGCVAFALVFAAGLVAVICDDVVACHMTLSLEPEPSEWRAWPVAPELGGFEIAGTKVGCIGHGMQCGLVDTELRDREVCPRSGVSLDGWFTGDIYQSPSDIIVRAHDGTFVVSGHNAMMKPPPPSDEKFLAAFRRKSTVTHPAFKHQSFILLAAGLAFGLCALIFSGVRARRHLVRAKKYRDPFRYTLGTRIDSGAIVFGDGTASIPAGGDAIPDRMPGPVLVRVATTREGSYRAAPSATAHGVIDGDVDAVTNRLVLAARTDLLRGFFVAIAISIVVWMGAIYWFISQIRID